MIKGIIIVNNSGQARICKFFQQVHREGYSPEEAQQSVVQQVYKQVSERPDSFCNYLEGSIMQWGDDTKLIYRHYATLYFVFAVDKLESDLGILDLIQVFVEALDKCFENVCELDLIFHSDKVHYILDEIVMAGMVLETNIVTILNGVNDQTKLHQKSTSKLNEALGKATSTKMGSPGVRGLVFLCPTRPIRKSIVAFRINAIVAAAAADGQGRRVGRASRCADAAACRQRARGPGFVGTDDWMADEASHC